MAVGREKTSWWKVDRKGKDGCSLEKIVWCARSSAGVFIKNRVNAAIYQEILGNFILLSADKLYGHADFLAQQNVAPAHSDNTSNNWSTDCGIIVNKFWIHFLKKSNFFLYVVIFIWLSIHYIFIIFVGIIYFSLSKTHVNQVSRGFP